MKHRVPDYYTRFKCIAGKCRHSCCIGWEIDIDGDTYERYRNIPGEIGRRIIDNTAVNDGVASFVLGKDERGPFLNKDGLCDIILDLGEDALCQICTEHPRFHNLRGDGYIESGVGLCCELLFLSLVILLLPQLQFCHIRSFSLVKAHKKHYIYLV